ncbi:MAG: AAA family ATPase [Bryobacterales bacterium]|jgi:general secretion pathway protein A|nr:AAA family ATPase [Bryobacterales bacterium]
MYKAFFGLNENPFNLSPDPRFFFRSNQHEEALANLIYGVQSQKGFIVLTGEVGTGKTTMLECLRNFLAQQSIGFAYLFNSRLTCEQFFDLMAYDFDLRCDRSSKTDVLIHLNQFLIQRSHRNQVTALIVDEAQNLDWNVLEEIRLLGNLENRRGKLLQIVLAGQPELDRKLDAPDFRQLKQRIALRCSLSPFREDETAEYINVRLEKAGMPDQQVFPPDVVAEIHFRSQGIPRVINAICDNLLLTAFAAETKVATMEFLDEVTTDLRLEWPGRRAPRGEYPNDLFRSETYFSRGGK